MAQMDLFSGLLMLRVLAVMPEVNRDATVAASLVAERVPLVLASLSVQPQSDWCPVGSIVMIPDGREARVTSIDGEVCRVLAYGEDYVSLWSQDMIEPVYPQLLPKVNFGH
jgi:hypothetical protein